MLQETGVGFGSANALNLGSADAPRVAKNLGRGCHPADVIPTPDSDQTRGIRGSDNNAGCIGNRPRFGRYVNIALLSRLAVSQLEQDVSGAVDVKPSRPYDLILGVFH